jgi:capsular exopolysaccharide synthesis family protein
MRNGNEIQVADYEVAQAPEIDLREYWEKLKRRKGTVLSVTAAVLALTAFWTFIQKPVYTAKSTVLIEKEPNILSFEQVFQVETMRDDFFQTQYRLLQSRSLAEAVVDKLRLWESEEFSGKPEARKKPVDPQDHVFRESLIDGFLDRLQVRPVRMTRLVELNFDAHDPRLAADCANALVEAFVDLNVNMKYAATEQASQFLSEQIDGLQKDIAAKSKELQRLESEANIIALSDKETTVIDRLGELNKALTAAQIERVQKEAAWNGIKNASADYIPEAVNNPLIQRLREDYVKLKREYEKMQERFQPDYPELQRLKVELEAARRSLEDETQNLAKSAYSEYQTALTKEKSLEAAFEEQKQEAFKMNSSAVLYNGLKIELQNKQNLLDSLLRRESETGVEARLRGLRTSNIRVVDRARVPVSPSKPRKARNLAVALMLGLMGGVGLAFLFEALDTSVKNAEDVERVTGLPTLGVVPKFSLESMRRGYYLPGRSGEEKAAGELESARRGGALEEDDRGGAIGAGEESDVGDKGGTGARGARCAAEDRVIEDESDAVNGVGFGRGPAGEFVVDLSAGDDSAPGTAGTRYRMEREGLLGSVEAYAGGRGGRRAAGASASGKRGRKRAGGKGAAEEGLEARSIELVPFYFPASRLAEKYRSIRTALLLSSADNPLRTIAVTSAMPKEGKTATVANLSVTLAQSGKTVVLVDADLRRPRLHRIFKVKNTYGLTTYLTDSVELRKVIKPTEVPDLYVINAGPLPPNPAELLGSEKMEKFINMLKAECDYLLFDLPPMLDISDALVLGAKVDGVIMVVRGDSTTREALKTARERLEMLKIRTVGVVINDVRAPAGGYYYKDYYSHYYRHHG